MAQERPLAGVSRLGVASLGVFRGQTAVELGISRRQLSALRQANVVERVLPDTYRLTAVARSNEQWLRAALLWAGDEAAAAGRSAGAVYGLEGVRASVPEILVPRRVRQRSPLVRVHRTDDRSSLMVR
jgi:hypothetical protein